MKTTRGGLVYSTDTGRMCPACRQPVAACACREKPAVATGDGIARVSRETHGRAGRGVTVVRGLALPPDALAALAKRLRTACATGGTVKGGVVELQGDHRDTVLQWLEADGHRAKRAGG